MRKMRQVAGLLGLPVLVVILMVYIVLHEPVQDGITRAMAAKLVALAICGPGDLDEWQKNRGPSKFPADMEKEWFVPYFDYLYANGYWSDDELLDGRKMAEGMLTYAEAGQLAERIDVSLVKKTHVSKGNFSEPMPQDRWWEFYEALLGKTDPEGEVHEETLLLYGTVENLPQAAPWEACTDQGSYYFTGLSLDAYIDQQIRVLLRDDEILRVIETAADITYQNVWLIDGDEERLHVYVGNYERYIPLEKKVKKLDAMVQNLADLSLSGGKVTKISLKKERVLGKLLLVREDELEIEGYGIVPVEHGCQVLKVYGTIEKQQMSDITVGYDNYEFVVADGKVCAILMMRGPDEEMVRVLLMNEGFKDIYHERVSLVGGGPLKVQQGEYIREMAAGETLEFFTGEKGFAEGRTIITPLDDSEITVTSLERADGQPSYGGRLEVLDTENGLVLINEIYLEEYLKKVVPSEMPGSYGLEALKAQAVCARTYASMQLHSNKYNEYGAQMDDSTNFQVYNNVSPEPRASEAVQATYGKLLLYDGEPISAYYYSTSCGNTTDGSVWEVDPGDTPYLKSVALQPSRRTFDWSNEEEFATFIKRKDVKAYDSDSPYFRWSVTTNARVLAQTFGGIGTIKGVQVTRRGAGGVALEIVVKGSDGEQTVSGQNSIRSALGDASLTLVRGDGKTSKGWDSLPSAFMVVEPDGRDEDGVQKFTIYGGGYGHGAGMSQNGAQGMAEAGMKYDEILKFFYEGVTIGEKNNKKENKN